MWRILARAALLAAIAAPAAAADSREKIEAALARARTLYNQRLFDAAIVAAEEARKAPERADSADLIVARSYLERYRESASEDDLSSARDRLRRINAERLDGRERSEYTIGLGQSLYFDKAVGAAADLFASVLEQDDLPLEARERVLDWWASALDRDARQRSGLERQTIYQMVRDRMLKELGANPAGAVAAYWRAAAAWGQGDLQAAWDAAQAGWVRAPLAADHGAALRGDLDRLVHRGIAPDRAKAVAQPPEKVRGDWELFKEKWAR
jgi:hypothetical protein